MTRRGELGMSLVGINWRQKTNQDSKDVTFRPYIKPLIRSEEGHERKC